MAQVWADSFERLAGKMLTGRSIFGGVLIVIAVFVRQWRSDKSVLR